MSATRNLPVPEEIQKAGLAFLLLKDENGAVMHDKTSFSQDMPRARILETGPVFCCGSVLQRRLYRACNGILTLEFRGI